MRKFLIALLLLCLPLGNAFAGFPGGWQGSLGSFDQDSDGRVDAAYGGTDLDSSSLSGVPYLDNGVWTALDWGTANYVLRMNATGDGIEWASGAGSGDVTGPASANDNGIVLFNGATGKAIKDSGFFITSAGGALLDDADAAAQRATLGLGTVATQSASSMTVTGGTFDGVTIGGSTPGAGTFTTFTATGTATLQQGGGLPDDKQLLFGTGSDYRQEYKSSTNQMLYSTTHDGSSMADSDAMFEFHVAVGGTLDEAQLVFAIKDDSTTFFKVDENGNGTFSGEVYAAGFNSTATDGYHYGNLLNTNGYSYTPVGGDFHFDNTVKGWSMYDDGLADDVIYAKVYKTFPITIPNPGESHDFPFWEINQDIVITKVSAIAIGGTNVVCALDEYNGTASSVDAAIDSDWTITTTESEDTSFTNAGVDQGDWLGIHVTSVSGAVDFLSITITYYETY